MFFADLCALRLTDECKSRYVESQAGLWLCICQQLYGFTVPCFLCARTPLARTLIVMRASICLLPNAARPPREEKVLAQVSGMQRIDLEVGIMAEA